ncbi:MAG: hypothetical protein ACPGLV_06595 [Bacteroidia bacterium]
MELNIKSTFTLLSLLAISFLGKGQCTTCWQTISSATSASINVPYGKRLCITSTGSVTGSIRMSGAGEICNEGTFEPSSFSSKWADAINNSGTMELPSNFNVTGFLTNSGSLTINGNLTSNSNKNILNSGDLDVNGYLKNSGELNNTGTIAVTSYYSNQKQLINSGTFNVDGNFTNSSSGGVDAENSGGITVGGNFINQGPFETTADGSLIITGYMDNTTSGSASFINRNILEVASYFDNGNDFSNYGTAIIAGDFTNENSGSTALDNFGDLTIDGDFFNYQSFDNSGVVEIDGDFIMTNTGSAELTNDSMITINGDLNSNNDINNSNALVVGGTYTNKKWSGSYNSDPASILVVDTFINQSNINSTSSEYGQIQVLSYAENEGNVGTYIDICILSDNGDWDSNTGTVNAQVTNCTQAVTTDLINLNIRFYLEACYNASPSKMQTELRSNKVLPKNQPFRQNPWGWNGTESVRDSVSDISTVIVDWVMVEFRTGTDASTSFWKKSLFLTEDGYLRDNKGNAATIERPDYNSFYVVITARNHLGVMTSTKCSIQGGAIAYDFTTAQSKAYTTGANPMIEVSTGVYGLISGDANGDGTINALDAMEWHGNTGSSGYKKADLNLDNQVNSNDKSVWENRNGRSIQYPK